MRPIQKEERILNLIPLSSHFVENTITTLKKSIFPPRKTSRKVIERTNVPRWRNQNRLSWENNKIPHIKSSLRLISMNCSYGDYQSATRSIYVIQRIGLLLSRTIQFRAWKRRPYHRIRVRLDSGSTYQHFRIFRGENPDDLLEYRLNMKIPAY